MADVWRWFRQPTRPREWVPWLTTAGIITIVGALLGITVSLWAVDHAPTPYEPISFTNPQRVQTTTPSGLVRVPMVEGVEGPAVLLDDGMVPVVSNRCNTEDEPVPVIGSVTWVRVGMRGEYVNVAHDVAGEFHPGCETRTFENPIPPQVHTSVEQDLDGRQVWQITGQVTPTAPGGVTVTWSTEPFTVVEDGIAADLERLRV